ncbi:MAG: WecB/TagA/CpsF family glycosyltransferase [Bacteroidetes bacterium]|nr:WecB/TagA/CpsF family glycosyltransferase [Bacteroidota bacterium]MCL5030244.1 WecB/TagA/CpsF family glycosyltransferase [Bacteroidota bacterium]
MNMFTLLGNVITSATYDEIINEVDNSIVNKRKFTFHNVNSYILLESTKNENLSKSLQLFDKLFLDGLGVYISQKIIGGDGYPLERITGTDLYYRIINYSVASGRKVFFYGINGLLSSIIYNKLRFEFPTLAIAGTESDGNISDAEVIARINDVKPDILFVGLGTPKQEMFLAKKFTLYRLPRSNSCRKRN